MINIKKLESDLWESADLLRAESKLTSNQYCMPVLGLIFLRYAYSRYKLVEKEILANRPSRNGRVIPVSALDFKEKSAIYLPKEAQFDYIVALPENVADKGLKSINGDDINSLGEVVNNAMELVESQSEQLVGVLPKEYTEFSDSLLSQILRIFNNDELNEVDGDVIGRIYEYFLNKFAKNVAQDDGVFFTSKSLVKMIVNVLEPKSGVLLDPACGSGGMFVQTGDFVNAEGMVANKMMTFYGQEKVDYNARLCKMNMAVHGLSGKIISGDAANSYYHDAHNLEGKCDYVMANPPFNVDKVKAETTSNAGRLPFGLPGYNAKTKEIGNANYLWISYFYAYLNDTGRAGFVMPSSATDSANKDRDIREQLIKTGDVDVMISVGNNFFYTLSLPCSLWFFDKAKKDCNRDKILFIDARNYYTVVDRTLNEWSEWQLKNLQAIVCLYRGEKENYKKLIKDYKQSISEAVANLREGSKPFSESVDEDTKAHFNGLLGWIDATDEDYVELKKRINDQIEQTKACVKSAETIIKRGKVKAMRKAGDDFCTLLSDILTTINEYEWLTSKFGIEGEYQDVLGLCKLATVSEVEEKNFSLTPGAYVGVAEVEDDGVDFHERMNEIHEELAKLNSEANSIMKEILNNWNRSI